MFNRFNNCSMGKAVISGLVAFNSLNAHATLTSYSSNGVDLVYSSVSNVTWTKDGNLLSSMFASQSFNTVVKDILEVSPTVTHRTIGRTVTYTLRVSDFHQSGQATWFGAMAFINYLNNINYAGSNQWILPTFTNPVFGYNTPSNGTTKGDEYSELFYQELNGSAYSNIPNTPTFTNEQSSRYWSSTEGERSFSNSAWGFSSVGGVQNLIDKNTKLHAWAISSGMLAAVPEPESAVMLLAGLSLFGIAIRRKVNQ